MKTTLTILILSLIAHIAAAQPNPRPQPPRIGPWDRDLVIATSKDGLTFDNPTPFTERGGVPHLCRDAKDRLIAVFQWFPFDKPEAFDKVAVRISADNGKNWSDPQPIIVKDLPTHQQRPFDPTLVLFEDGRLRLYFTGTNPDHRTPAIYSAISSDAVNYTFEPGQRLAVEGQPVIDCAAVRLGKTFHLFAPVQRSPSAYHAISDDGLTFKHLTDISIPNDTEKGRAWLGFALPTPEGIRFYGTFRERGWSAVSKDGNDWKLDETTSGLGLDPGVAQTADGRFLVVATGRPRADAGTLKPPRRKD